MEISNITLLARESRVISKFLSKNLNSLEVYPPVL